MSALAEEIQTAAKQATEPLRAQCRVGGIVARKHQGVSGALFDHP